MGNGLTERRGHVFLLCPLFLQLEHVILEGREGVDIFEEYTLMTGGSELIRIFKHSVF